MMILSLPLPALLHATLMYASSTLMHLSHLKQALTHTLSDLLSVKDFSWNPHQNPNHYYPHHCHHHSWRVSIISYHLFHRHCICVYVLNQNFVTSSQCCLAIWKQRYLGRRLEKPKYLFNFLWQWRYFSPMQ